MHDGNKGYQGGYYVFCSVLLAVNFPAVFN